VIGKKKKEAHSLPSVSGRYQPDGLPSIICVDGQTLPKRRPQTKDAQAPVPRVDVFPIMSLLKSELNGGILFRLLAYRLVATFAFSAEIPSLQVGPLGHPRPWLFRESRSCVVELVARQSTGWVCLSFQFRVSSWIVIAAHRREMYLVGGRRSPGLSPFRQWPFSPWSIGCSVQGQKLEHIDSARSRPSLQGLSLGVVSTPYCRAAKLTLVH